MGRIEYMVYLTKVMNFSSAHRTYNVELSETENIDIFGKCATSHGHNYTLEITMRGNPCPTREILFNPSLINQAFFQIISPFSHQDLNEITCFAKGNIIPTTENFIEVLWGAVNESIMNNLFIDEDSNEPKLHSKVELYKLRLRETARNYFDYYGPSQIEHVI